jgi:hypothetical protein
MVKEPLLPRLGSGSSLNELRATISLFKASHLNLLNDGNGLPEIIPEHKDLLRKWMVVDQAWKAFRSAVQSAKVGPVGGQGPGRRVSTGDLAEI